MDIFSDHSLVDTNFNVLAGRDDSLKNRFVFDSNPVPKLRELDFYIMLSCRILGRRMI